MVSAAGNSVTLKRRAALPGVGLPPPAAGSILFSCLTMAPQIAKASADLERRFGVSDFIVGRRVSDLWNPEELRDATVYTVLIAAYLDASRGTTPDDKSRGEPDVWGSKSRSYGLLLSELLARVELHWRPTVQGAGECLPPTSSRLVMRLVR